MESETHMMNRKFRQWQKQKRKEAVVEVVSSIILLALLALMVKLWFVAEGFSIQW